MSEATFVHLRVHSEYSLVDSVVRIKPLIESVNAANMQAVALTDVCNLYAAVKFYHAATKAKVKPIFGSDVLVKGEGDDYFELTLLCQNEIGYLNLTRLISKGYLEARRENGIPILEAKWFSKESMQGLIALSGARRGALGQMLLKSKKVRAEKILKYYQKCFPDNRFYIDLQRLGHPDDETYVQKAVRFASQHRVPVVATHSVRFIEDSDFDAHEVRVCINQGTTLEDDTRAKETSEVQYLTTPEHMAELYSDIPEAIENTVELSKRCNVHLDLGRVCLPEFPVPEGMTVDSYFRQVSEEGLEDRLRVILTPEAEDHEATRKTYIDRLNRELDVILEMGFPGYFLIVADFIQWAKENDIPVGPGRGSGAGSLVAYALKITDIDPIPYDLLFERFLNPERVSMPDFDIDFCIEGRDRVIDYVARKYGRQSVSQIITFGSMAAKAAIRDVGRVLGHPYGFIDKIAKMVPMDLGMTIGKALEEEEALKSRYEYDEEVQALIDMALRLEGTVRNVGKHAGGVVIAPSVLTDFSAIYCEEGSKQIVSQFDKNDVEDAGLVKFDFLGLRNLTIIDHALKTVNVICRKKNQPEIDINHIPLDDVPTFDLLKRCETTAVFQLESRGMKDLIRRLQPDNFEEIVALVALFRPGPLQSGMVDDFINRKHGRAKLEYPHEMAADLLKPTQGIILYQEQVMLLSQVLAGYTLGGADLLRRAMGKKKPEEMAKQRTHFVEGAKTNGIDEETSAYIFDLIEKFAGYGFNKSHSAAYALIAYQTAWLKAHYPAAFMAAVLSSDMDNTDKVVIFYNECMDMKLKVHAPDVNVSSYQFTVNEHNEVVYGLGAIKGVGQQAIEMLIADREKNGPFKDLFDLCRRLDLQKLNRRALEPLILSGACDGLGPNRATLMASLNDAMKVSDQYGQSLDSGQAALFSLFEEDTDQVQVSYVKTTPWSLKEQLQQEKAALGLFLSGHLIDVDIKSLRNMRCTPLNEIKPTGKKQTTKIAGVLISYRTIKTKRGDTMAILLLDDKTSQHEVVLFSKVFEEYRPLLSADKTLIVEAEISEDTYSGGLRSVGQSVMDMPMAIEKFAKKLVLNLNHTNTQIEALAQIKSLVGEQGSGHGQLVFQYQNTEAQVRLVSSHEVGIVVNIDLINKIKQLDCVHDIELVY